MRFCLKAAQPSIAASHPPAIQEAAMRASAHGRPVSPKCSAPNEIRPKTPLAAASNTEPTGTAKSVPLWLSYVSPRPRKSSTCVRRTDQPFSIGVCRWL